MCRYGMSGPYKQHYACFDCRKSFKWPMDARQSPPGDTPESVKCPQCGAPMHSMGLDFRAPPQRNARQWKKVLILYTHGVAYHSCGCGGPGYRPRTLAEVPAFLAGRRATSEGEALLKRISSREADRARRKRDAHPGRHARS